MDTETVVKAFNLWMDEYTNNPDAFRSSTASALQHIRERAEGREPSYGEDCAAILAAYMAKVDA